MAESRPARTWIMRGTFVLLAVAIMFYHLLPLDLLPPAAINDDPA